MRVMKLTFTISAIALLLGTAQAAPKKTAPVDHIQTVCKTTIHDSNGKMIGQRETTVDSKGIVARTVRGEQAKARQWIGGPGYEHITK